MKASKLGRGCTCINIGCGRFADLNLKSGAGQFSGLSFKTEGTSGASGWRLLKARSIIAKFVEVKQSREGDVSVQWSSKKLYSFTPEGYLRYIIYIKVFWSSARCLYICEGAPYLFASLYVRSSHFAL